MTIGFEGVCLADRLVEKTKMSRTPPRLLGLLLVAFTSRGSATLPYTPTTLLKPTGYSDTIIYILQDTGSNEGKAQLTLVNASSTLSSDSFTTTTISQELPFSTGHDDISYTALLDGQGHIHVFSGRCKEAARGASLWTFVPSPDVLSGSWGQENLTIAGTDSGNMVGGVNQLASGMAFSSIVNGTSDLYIFGGMCSNNSAGTVQDWQNTADYSNDMLIIQRTSSSSPPDSVSTLSTLSSRGPPVPEAGFTVTPLVPTFYNSSDSDPSQHHDFVLLGGHTSEAFINMSQVALFSLPEQSWAFLPVSDPPQTPKTDLAARNPATIDPRSGHTAVLTQDGKRIVVFGGWVGNVSNPAGPQLVILELGRGYGGVADWRWTVPDEQGSGLPSGAGLYGHGATMLPGGVMMIVGGYPIPSPEPTTSKRHQTRSPSSTVYFFNVTSSTWISTYSNPGPASLLKPTADPGSNNNNLVRRAGLGAGLGFGLAAVLLLALIYFCYNRRVKRRRAVRDVEFRKLSLGAHRFSASALGLGGIDGRGGDDSAVRWMEERQNAEGRSFPWSSNSGTAGGGAQNTVWKGAPGTEAERTGLLVEIPSPTRGLRRSLHSRGGQPSRYDDGRRSRGSGHIHRIDERDEDEQDPVARTNMAEPAMSQIPGTSILASAPALDPFCDPLGSHPVTNSRSPSPQTPARERELELQSWMNDWTAAENLMHQQAGRISPDKTDRTSSTLSERSNHSAVSALSIQQSVGSMSRSISQRSAAFFGSRPLSTTNNNPPNQSPTWDNPAAPNTRDSHISHGRSKSLTSAFSLPKNNASGTSAPLGISFPQLQIEGEALLGGSPRSPTSPTRTQSRARGWMGSMRRALTGGDRVSAEHRDYSSVSSSPTKDTHTDSGMPRRAASAGAMLWRTRQGARDWDVEGNGTVAASGKEGDSADAEWDVESAIEKRVVQVMFTVPKEKLRVVNAGPEGDGESVVSMERAKEEGVDEEKGKERAS